MASIDPAAPARVPPAVAQQAIDWLLALPPENGAQRARHHQDLQAWLAQDPVKAQAWARIAEVDGQLRGVPASVALQTLASPALGRRRAVQLAALLTAGAGGLLAARQTTAWHQLAADLRTATGEQRDAVLADGTRLRLNTASAVDVRYSATERLLVLRAGEVQVQTAPDPAPAADGARPLRVQTAEGRVQAIGTRFTVRQHSGRSAVAVLQGAVDLVPEQSGASGVRRVQAGEQCSFTRKASARPEALADATSAWVDGMVIADGMRLADFLAELSRHRPGVLRSAPEVADLRVSGSYPLADTDRVLAALTLSLPVQIHLRTRWWVTVEPAQSG